MKSLSNYDLEDIMRGTKGFRGVFMRDQLPKKIRADECGIVNSDDSEGDGIHWVCYRNSRDGIEYFDSYGMIPAPEVTKYLKTSGKTINYNNAQLQKLGSSACGWYCAYYLKKRAAGVPAYDILYEFDQFPSEYNEKHIGGARGTIKMHGKISKTGAGFDWNNFASNFSINNILNNIPMPELHLPSVNDRGEFQICNFCGPFTKLEKRLKNFNPKTGTYTGIITRPINELDWGCLDHDIEYTKHQDTKNRNIADAKLAAVADRVAAKTTGALHVGSKAVSAIMHSKVKNGWGFY